ncbi:acyltransferase family protein [Serratia marcescens]|uniref:acyltransferase family protein n=1 Tax=Serratia TaxID=613 RepID=UPI000664DA97|nr:acyltransferase [Serratia marcescens]MEB6082053.1 acyltransferase [Serratia marcescens]TBU70083.1 acyltransferase [Serratia marcescens]WJD89458.1 acyltransferase [Serratia marcescens]HAT5004545.1 acyltransferase [Serratia marcescens]
MSNTKKERIDGPDILRGFAAISVIVVHLIASSQIDFGHVITLIGSKFTASVTLFFTISAFSIAYAYNDGFINKTDFKNFYIKRFFRLAPLFYLAMIVEGVIIYYAFQHTPSAFEVLMSGTFLFNLVPKMQDGIVWAGWSLSIEWVFYLLYPVIFIFSNNKKTIVVLWMLCVFISSSIAKVQAEPIEIYMNILNHMVFFISGIFVYLYLKELQVLGANLGRYSGFVSGLIMSSLMALLIYCFAQDGYPFNIYIVYPLIWVGMIASSIIGIPALINNRFTRFLGKASYSIYLMHGIVLYLLKAVGTYRWVDTFAVSGPMKFLISILITAVLTIAISYLSYRYIEEPGIKLGKRFISKRNASSCSVERRLNSNG